MKIYTLKNKNTNKLWTGIDDINSSTDWGEHVVFWLDEKKAENCLKFYQQKGWEGRFNDYGIVSFNLKE